jgi:hypothetical protein
MDFSFSPKQTMTVDVIPDLGASSPGNPPQQEMQG